MPSDDCFRYALTEPAIEDVDSDGGLEVIVSSIEDVVIAHSAESGTNEWRAPLHTYGYGRPHHRERLFRTGTRGRHE
jgi:hypothetical protein